MKEKIGEAEAEEAEAVGEGEEEVTKYLLSRLRELERECIQLRNENNRIKSSQIQRMKWLEERKRALEEECIQMEREIRRLRSELNRMRTMPLLVGTVVEVVDDQRLVVKSSSGPTFMVNTSQFVDTSRLKPGARVVMNQQSLAVVDVLPAERDPAVVAMEIVEKPQESYSDIGGLDAQLREVRETVELPLLKPEVFEKVGIDPPKGVLLYGPPGTGKTLIAKAVAKETNSVFIKLIGSELVRKYIGEGARMVRELFELAREKAPSIVFIDEIDAIAARRTDAHTSGEREVQRTLMQLLAEMDGFDARGDVRILAATNRPDILDPALLRPGRFDRLIEVPLPDEAGRAQIFRIHTRRMNLGEDVVLEELASMTEGASGADIRAICTEAGMFAIRDGRTQVEMGDFRRAIARVLVREGNRVSPELMFA